MSVLFRRAVEHRSSALNAPVTYSETYPGTSSMESALRLTPVYAAVSLVSEALISVPLHSYRQSAAGSVRVNPDPAIVADPSPWVDPLTWRGQYVASMLLRGNAFGLVTQWTGTGYPSQIQWLHPDTVSVDVSNGTPRYMYGAKEIDRSAIIHVRSVTLPGSVVGLSPVQLFRSQLSSASAAADLQANIYKTGGPAAHFKKTDRTLTADESSVVKERFRAQIAAGDLLVTGNDWDYTSLGMSPADAQFIEAAKLSANQIAAIFHVPADEIGGETGSSLTYSTLEMNDLKFVRRGVAPWAVRLEAALTSALPRPQYVKFNLDAYVRTDLMTRMRAHAIALTYGIETLDEVRGLEDRQPLSAEQVATWQEQYKSHPSLTGAGQQQEVMP